MSYHFESHHVHLPRDKDRRVKLSDKERADIRERYQSGEGIRSIARAYEDKCSRRLVQIVLFPERGEIIAKQSKDREQHKISYARVQGAQWAQTMREHRHYKHLILKNN